MAQSNVSLTELDFDNCVRGKRGLKQLQEKFYALKGAVVEDASPSLRSFVMQTPRSTYVPRIREQQGGDLRDVMWMGFGHKMFVDSKGLQNPRVGVQLQFGISRQSIVFNGIWIDGIGYAQKARRNAQMRFFDNLEEFRRLLGTLPSEFYMGLYDRSRGRDASRYTIFKEYVSDVVNNEEKLAEFLAKMPKREVHVAIAAHLSKRDAISKRHRLPRYIASNFAKLLPLYSLAIGKTITSKSGHQKPEARDITAIFARKSKHAPASKRSTARTMQPPPYEIDKESARRAEITVLNYEKTRLRAAGRKLLARRVKDVSKRRGFGFDIESWMEDGKEKMVEVKSTKAGVMEGFYLTASEWDAAQNGKKSYCICIVTHSNSNSPKIGEIPNFASAVGLRKYRLTPYVYYVTPA